MTETSRLTVSKMAECNKNLVIECNKPSLRIPRSISFDSDLLERLDMKCRELSLNRSEIIRRLVRNWLDEHTESKLPRPESTSEQFTEAQRLDPYLEAVKTEWPTRPQEWRDKTARYIAKTYGPTGEAFLANLSNSSNSSRQLSASTLQHPGAGSSAELKNPEGDLQLLRRPAESGSQPSTPRDQRNLPLSPTISGTDVTSDTNGHRDKHETATIAGR
jgi:hypothetical protein